MTCLFRKRDLQFGRFTLDSITRLNISIEETINNGVSSIVNSSLTKFCAKILGRLEKRYITPGSLN